MRVVKDGAAEQSLIDRLTDATAEQSWWLDYLDTGAGAPATCVAATAHCLT